MMKAINLLPPSFNSEFRIEPPQHPGRQLCARHFDLSSKGRVEGSPKAAKTHPKSNARPEARAWEYWKYIGKL